MEKVLDIKTQVIEDTARIVPLKSKEQIEVDYKSDLDITLILIEKYKKDISVLEKIGGKINTSYSLPISKKEIEAWDVVKDTSIYSNARIELKRYETLLTSAIIQRDILKHKLEIVDEL